MRMVLATHHLEKLWAPRLHCKNKLVRIHAAHVREWHLLAPQSHEPSFDWLLNPEPQQVVRCAICVAITDGKAASKLVPIVAENLHPNLQVVAAGQAFQEG